MINSYKQLTIKYLKANKKRTLLTIIGIVLSVALISSIGLFLKGMQAVHIDEVKGINGAFHLGFQNPDESLIAGIANNPRVSRSGLFAMGEDIKVNEELVICKVTATDKALELLPCKVKQGRLPEDKNEVAVEEWVWRYIDKNAGVGGTIRIKDAVYTLSGVLQDGIGDQIGGEGILLSKDTVTGKDNTVLLVEISPKADLKASVKELKQLGKEGTVSENIELLAVQGAGGEDEVSKALNLIVGIIIGIVGLVTIAVIYNAFQISVVERVKQFGLLRAVGTTPKQIRRIVLGEATVLAVIGVPLGLVYGIAAIYGIYMAFQLIGGDSLNFIKPVISPAVIGISALVGTASIYVSALIPALFAGRISPLVAISSRASITKEKLKKRKTVIAGRLFGFEGALAAKNMKRNRKRYAITVFSIAISVVLFITFKSFADMSLKVSNDLDESQKIHYAIAGEDRTLKKALTIDNEIIDKIKGLESVKEVYKMYGADDVHAVIDRDKEIKELQTKGKLYKPVSFQGEEKTLMKGSVVVYDDRSLEASQKYLASGVIDAGRMNEENGVILIEKNRIYNKETKKTYYGAAADLKVGDEIYLEYKDKPEAEFGKGTIKKAKVMAILKNDPFRFTGSQEGLKLITTEAVAGKLTGKAAFSPLGLNLVIKDVKNPESARNEIEKVLQSDASLKLISILDRNRDTKSIILMTKILLYGFVIVVSLIGSVNIINTLTTNIILRKREFATLKSIGLTQKGLRKMIMLEGILYGITGTVYGAVVGSGLSFLLYTGINHVRELGWRFPWNAIIIAGACAMLTGYLSVLSPLARIKKTNLIEAIREEY